MAKAATAETFVPKTFVPSRKQYEDGIKFKNGQNIIVTITKSGYRPATKEDQDRLEKIIKRDGYSCGICEHGKQEMDADTRTETVKNIALQKENEKLQNDRAELLERLRILGGA